MKESIYFSDKLKKQILPLYIESFHSQKVKNNCCAFVSDICDYCKCDFLELDTLQAQSFFNHLFFPGTEKKRPALSTVRLKYATMHAFSNYVIRNAAIFQIVYNNNPFDLVQLQTAEPYIEPDKIPSPKEINEILHQAEGNPSLYAALTLIIKCGFTVGELTRLRQDSFILDDNDQAAVVFSYRSRQRYIKIPEDVLAVLDYYWNEQVFHTEYLFENKHGKPLRVRDMERLYRSCMGEQFRFTLSDLRNGCIALLSASGAPAKKLGDYVGIKQYHWLRRYDKVIPELSLAACDYSNLSIKLPSQKRQKTTL